MRARVRVGAWVREGGSEGGIGSGRKFSGGSANERTQVALCIVRMVHGEANENAAEGGGQAADGRVLRAAGGST